MTRETATYTKTRPPARTNLGEGVYDDGYLRVEHDNYYVSCGGKYIKLFPKEFLILSRLAQTPGEVVTLRALWEYVWEEGLPFNAITLRTNVYHLRQKISPYEVEIEGIVNVGYRLHSDTPAEGRVTWRRSKAKIESGRA